MSSRSVAALVAVLLLAAALRLTAVLTWGDVQVLRGDEGWYVRAARSLAAGTGYTGALRPPGHPALLSVVFAAGGDLREARFAQIAVSLAGIAMLFGIVRAGFGTLAATLSALLMALHPTLISYTHFLWTETLVATLLLLAFWCLDRAERSARDGWLVGAGLALGAAVLTRDMLFAFVPVVLLWLAIGPAPRTATRIRRMALVALPVVLLIAPWMARNYVLLGKPFVLSTNSWFPIAVGNLLPEKRILGMSQENREFHERYLEMEDELERAAYARETALAAIAKEQPWWIVRKVLRNTYYLFSTASQLKRFVKSRWLARGWNDFMRNVTTVEATYYAVTMVLGIVALWLVPGGRLKLLVVALILFHWAVYIVANANHRFRVPLLPFFLLYVGPLLVGAGRRTVRERWRLAGAGASLAAFAAVLATPWLRRLLVALLVVPLLTGCQTTSATSGPPNVVLVSIDTLRPDHLGVYGYERTTSPNIDALARDGVVFENAVSPSSWTLPAHASMLTGVSPYRHGAVTSATPIRDDVPLLAELLRAHGFHTIGLINAPFVNRSYGFARGFERFEQSFARKKRDGARRHAAVLEAVRTLEPPFFLFVHYMDVHWPYRPPKAFNRFARDRRGKNVLQPLGVRGFLDFQKAVREGRVKLSAEDRQRLVDLYDGEILAMDAKIAELVEAVRERAPNTVFVITSDHGEEFFEHDGFGHSRTLYEEVVRVPLIVFGPGVARGERVSALVSLLDVVPTVLELAGAPLPQGLEGSSLVPALRGDDLRRDDTLIALQTSSHDGYEALRGVRSPTRKLLHDGRSDRSELFDLARDPGERTNLWPATKDERLEAALAALQQPERGRPLPTPDADTVEALKALGYL
ncbi:MAG TPA: sulfatase-like hydrolase/transferase [Candidatus Binatia bacterium]